MGGAILPPTGLPAEQNTQWVEESSRRQSFRRPKTSNGRRKRPCAGIRKGVPGASRSTGTPTKECGGVLLSHTLSSAVPSPRPGLSFRVRKGTGRLTWAMTTAKPIQRPTGRTGGRQRNQPRFRSWRSGNRTTDASKTLHRYRFRDHKKQRSLPSNERNHHRTRPDPASGSEKVCRVRPLVPVGSTPRGASTSGLSNTCSTCGLRTLRGASRNPNLGAGFPLRCFQRLSLPNVANRPCRWRDNRHTRGPSTQVLSYYGQASSGFQRAQRIETKLSHDVLNPARVPL